MELFFRKYGRGSPIIIAHGLYGSSDNWVSIAKMLENHFEVFLLDLRNHGKSPHSNIHNYSAMCSDLCEFINSQQITKASFIGHSMGGKLMMQFANTCPQYLNNLIVVDIAPKSYLNHSNFNFHYQLHYKILTTMKNIDVENAVSRQAVENEMRTEIKSEQLVTYLMKNLSRNANKGFCWKINVSALLSNLDEILIHSSENEVAANNNFPVCFFKGELSDYIQQTDYQAITRQYKFAQIIEIPNASHWLHVEQPHFLAKKIIDFLFS